LENGLEKVWNVVWNVVWKMKFERMKWFESKIIENYQKSKSKINFLITTLPN